MSIFKINKIYQVVLIIGFILLIWIPYLEMNFPFIKQLESTEKRNLHQKPKFDILHPYRFTSEYENYFNDNFGFRNNLITIRSKIMLYIFNQSPTDSVIIGKNGILFFTTGLGDIVSRPPYSKAIIEWLKNAYEQEQALLNNNDIYYISVIAPDKHTIYPEYLPNILLGQVKNPRLDQRITFIKEINNSQEIDLRPALMKAKKQYALYYKTDTHWNNYGSFIVYQEIMKNLKQKFTNLEPLSMSDFNISATSKKGADLSNFIALPNSFTDTEVKFSLKAKSLEKIKDSNKINKVIIYYDSFFDPKYTWGTVNFLANHFKHVITVSRYKAFDNDFILKEKPDVVIYESVESEI